ncbi:MAG: hypothetical protein ACTSU5_15065 [Promethearchaeota archaeon]
MVGEKKSEKRPSPGKRGNQVARAGLVAVVAVLALAATLPFVVPSEVRGAPWGKPSLANPHVRATRSDRLVFTYYFYWYDWASGQHFRGGGCDDHNTFHPVDQTGVSFKDPAWHYREFKDVMAAGIDVVLPVFWGGNPGSGKNDSWSKQGLGPMQSALDRLESEGAGGNNPLGVENPVPKVGMFFDTTAICLEYNDPSKEFGSGCTADLTNETHRETFYLMIRDFFSAFREEHVQQVPNEDDPQAPTAYIVWLYGDNWFARVDQSGLDYCKNRFLEDFNHSLVFVGTPGWADGCGRIDGLYRWGTSVRGVERIDGSPIDVVSLGPGFDNGNESHGAVCQVGQDPLFTPRSPGYYSGNWSRALEMDPNWIVVETWNELHEGTSICRTLEYGDEYINLTAKYSQQFHAVAPRRDQLVAPLLFDGVLLLAASACVVAASWWKGR